MEASNEELASRMLQGLLQVCQESETGLRCAAGRCQKQGLKDFLAAEALQRSVYIAELELELRKLSCGTSRKPEPAKLPGWDELRRLQPLACDDGTVLLLCEQGQKATLEHYLKILQTDLPVAALQLVERQHAQQMEAYDRLCQVHQLRQGEGKPGWDHSRDETALLSPGREYKR